MKPFFLLLLSLSFSLVFGQEDQQDADARVKSALDPHYATLLSLSPSENDVFVDMMYELLDHQMTVPEIVEKLNELKKAKVHGLLIKKGSAKNEKDLKKMEISKMQKTKEEKMAADQLGEIKKTKHSSSPIDNIASHLRKEEREVIGDMVMELVDGHMTAEEFLNVLSHTSPAIYAALTRTVNSINLRRFAKSLKLDKEDKEVIDVVEDMLHELVHGQMTMEEFLSVLEHTAPSAHRFLTYLHTRVAGLKEKDAKAFVEKVTHALRAIGKALFAHQDGEMTKAQKDREVMVQLTNLVKDYAALRRNSEAASEELKETFPDVLAIGQAASINKSQMGGYL
ncbi:hypothetical protein PRIPAC_94013 [Pristionchus pacificus]|uniref:Uncharacterized protein n=1 Tax=Pristionchus pacificus TaxID=54126 RepID=A0A2A6CDN1_PRIPA|nr:hypothetical protein PRIPAC_94013 [Pristionchus pacificus]|eukprot:PDM76322.1 hypothetical protein PRIPAC_39926 [Pristionchus pacificus]